MAGDPNDLVTELLKLAGSDARMHQIELALELDQHTAELQNLCIETGMYLEVTGYAHPRDWCRLHGDWCVGCRAAYDREQLALALIFGPDEQDAPCDCGYCNEDSED